MTRKAFEFNKSYEELEIAGKEYRIDFDDDAILRFTKAFDKFYTETQKIDKVDVTKISAKEQEELLGDIQKLNKGIIEELLGEGSYSVIYDAAGGSTSNVIDVIYYLSEVIGEWDEKLRSKRAEKYLVKKKRK